MRADKLTITDHRTGRDYDIPIENRVLEATSFEQMRTDDDPRGLLIFDPGLEHTAICRSSIGAVDSAAGTLHYRGYPVEELAQHSTFLETAYLIVKGELPSAERYAVWEQNIKRHTMLHESVRRAMGVFRYDAPPMAIMLGTIGILSAFYPDAGDVQSLESRRVQTRRLIGKVPTIAALAYRHSRGLPDVYPDNTLSYAGNFLSMIFKMTELEYHPNAVVERALDALFILYADHAQNCSTAAARVAGSSLADPYAAVAAATAAMSGPEHGGRAEHVLRMLERIGDAKKVPAFLASVRSNPGRTPGLGHGLYHHRDPRAVAFRPIADAVFAEVGPPGVLPIAREIERVLADDDGWAADGIFPTVDFYAALVFDAMGIDRTMFPVLHAIPRVASWAAHWAEIVVSPEHTVARPRQVYVGATARTYVPIDRRPDRGDDEISLDTPL